MTEAGQALGRGQPDQAAGLYMQAVGRQPSHRPAWHGLVLALAQGGQLALIPGVIDLWTKWGGRRFDMVQDAFFLLLSYRRLDDIPALVGLLPKGGPNEAIFTYAQASALILKDREDEAFVHINRFKQVVELYGDQLPIGAEDAFNVAYRQGTLVEDLDYVDRLMELAPMAAPDLRSYGPIRLAQSPQLVAASCNDRYFHLFAPEYCRALNRLAPGALVHLHVMEPNHETEALARSLMADCAAITLNITWEPPHAQRSRAYFASNRFLIAPRLMEIYGRDLLLSDMDIAFICDPRELAPLLADQAFACYAYEDGFGPASRHIAYLCHLSHAQGGAQVMDVVGRFIGSKLHLRPPFNWMLDQAALFSALRWLRHRKPHLPLGRMNHLLDRPASAIFAQQDQDDAKEAAIQAVITPA